MKKFTKKALAASALTLSGIGAASATVLADSQAALAAATADGQTMGGYVVIAVVGIATIGILIAVVRKV